MSLDTLLEAAKYLDHIERTDSSDGERHDSIGTDSFEDSDEPVVPSATYHLKVDPNLPISVQFHTYTSCAAGLQAMAPIGQSGVVSKPWNSSTKLNAQQKVGNIVMNAMNNSSTIRPSINTINTNNNFSINNTNTENNNKIRDHSSYSRHREMHKTLEKNRRAHLRHCFEVLKDELPPNEYNEKKSSHINIISCAIRYIHVLKRTESDLQHQTERLVRTKIRFQSQIAQLKDDLKQIDVRSDIGALLQTQPPTHRTRRLTDDSLQFEPQIDEQSDEEVIIELENEECYDDETTTTASECADDIRSDGSPSKGGQTSQTSLASALIYKCHA